LTLQQELPFNSVVSMRQVMKGIQMFSISKVVARHGLIRKSALLAILAPVLFVAACAQPAPPPPPVQAAPPPAPIPAARG
jgi:hypothetical protein